MQIRKLMMLCAVALSLVALSPAAAHAQQTTTITVAIVTDDNVGLPGQRVIVECPKQPAVNFVSGPGGLWTGAVPVGTCVFTVNRGTAPGAVGYSFTYNT